MTTNQFDQTEHVNRIIEDAYGAGVTIVSTKRLSNLDAVDCTLSNGVVCRITITVGL